MKDKELILKQLVKMNDVDLAKLLRPMLNRFSAVERGKLSASTLPSSFLPPSITLDNLIFILLVLCDRIQKLEKDTDEQ